MPRKCSYLNGRKSCGRVASGNPPLCREHHEALQAPEFSVDEDFIDGLIDGVMESPRVKGVVSKVSTAFDGFAQAIDSISRGQMPSGWKRSDPPPSPNGHAAPPPNGHARRPPPPPPRPLRPPDWVYHVLAFEPGQKLSEADIKERRRELAMAYHGDRAGKDVAKAKRNELAMKRVNEAADLLLRHMGAKKNGS